MNETDSQNLTLMLKPSERVLGSWEFSTPCTLPEPKVVSGSTCGTFVYSNATISSHQAEGNRPDQLILKQPRREGIAEA